MTDIWKKWLKNPGGMRVVLAFLYLFATFGVPLNHTCKLSDKDRHNYNLECTSHQLQNDNHIEVHYTTIFNQNSLSDRTDSHNLYCPACLYSLTSKTLKLCSNSSVCSTQAVVRTQILPQLNFTKQLEWLSSVSLRAPPNIVS